MEEAPELNQEAAPEQTPDESAPAQDIVDIDALEKFKYGGKEWTPQDFKSKWVPYDKYQRSISQYTKDAGAYKENSKYWSALQYDLKLLKDRPDLADEFRSKYPADFHYMLDVLGLNKPLLQGQQQQQQQAQQFQNDPRLLARIESIEKAQHEKEVASIEAKLDVKFSELGKKYPLADEGAVISVAEAMISRGEKITDQSWDAIFKEVNTRFQKLAEKHYQGIVQKQKTASARAKDTAPGGGIPSQAPKRLTMKEATEAAIRDLQAGR